MRGPYTIRGYYNAEQHNRTAFTPDGFYRSGDLVRKRPDGNLVVEGRIKEQVNRAGEKISCSEMQAHLCAHPDVEDAVLLGIADPALGERTCAVLIARESRPTLAALHDFLRERGLPRFKLPDELWFVKAWPLTPIGKIDRKRLAATNAPTEPTPGAFIEETLSISMQPLVMAALLSEHEFEEEVTVYERDGEWSVGIGSVAEIGVDAQKVVLRHGKSVAQWPAADMMRGVTAALAALPFQKWRAYGLAEFELSRTFLDLPPVAGQSTTLLQLTIPRMECRLREGQAVLRALDKADLQRLRVALEHIESRGRTEADVMAVRQQAHRLDVRGVDGAGDYRRATAAAIQEIAAGRYQKVILSHTVPLERHLDMAATYVMGRRANQPVRSFLVSRPGFRAAGFSPETVVEVDADGWVGTQPLAGTRALGEDEARNTALARELASDLKEVAEHAVSVKLAFEELSTFCTPDTVHVSEYMAICRRGSVQHLGSKLKGRLLEGCNGWDAFRALFPAVTASGIPKREAIDAIGRHEGAPRGLYSGCVLVADQDGFLDAALVLRAMYQRDGRNWLRAGAGIVGLSTPERELEETSEKLRSVMRHLVALPERASAPMPLHTVAQE
ncbi:salicylate synthase [Verminephrobacter eiseniae]|uniref:salicylate synthase n=1 Tax=Verminephrobacter eiseniae TaxID=364317 RepID=UPI0022374C5A|nr:salicylate synthase [Verminephrobacter eiseniae]